jgi:hypothetical protein
MQATFCPFELEATLKAALDIVSLCREHAPR